MKNQIKITSKIGKREFAIMVIAVACLVPGCATTYNITLTNNNVITSRGKPKYDPTTGTYQFKDAFGRTNSVPAFRIKEIAPQ